jgi:hypothetical protein
MLLELHVGRISALMDDILGCRAGDRSARERLKAFADENAIPL